MAIYVDSSNSARPRQSHYQESCKLTLDLRVNVVKYAMTRL